MVEVAEFVDYDVVNKEVSDRPHAPLRPSDDVVVAPHNAQVDKLTRTLRRHDLGDVIVSAVDKFQGREAAIALYSLAASTAEDAPPRHGLPL